MSKTTYQPDTKSDPNPNPTTKQYARVTIQQNVVTHSICIQRNSALFKNKPNKNNELKPITTVCIDHVLPKIDLEIEHVLIGVENRRRFSESKIGVVFA